MFIIIFLSSFFRKKKTFFQCISWSEIIDLKKCALFFIITLARNHGPVFRYPKLYFPESSAVNRNTPLPSWRLPLERCGVCPTTRAAATRRLWGDVRRRFGRANRTGRKVTTVLFGLWRDTEPTWPLGLVRERGKDASLSELSLRVDVRFKLRRLVKEIQSRAKPFV